MDAWMQEYVRRVKREDEHWRHVARHEPRRWQDCAVCRGLDEYCWHCDICREVYHQLDTVPLGVGEGYVAAHDFETDEDAPGLQIVRIFTPLTIIEHFDQFFGGGGRADDPLQPIVCPYIVRVESGEVTGRETAAYWCEVSAPEGGRAHSTFPFLGSPSMIEVELDKYEV